MRTKTAEATQNVLDYAIAHLAAFGRPRKPLGKARPIKAKDGTSSLTGALREACKVLGVTDHVRREVNAAVFWAVSDRLGYYEADQFYRWADSSLAGAVLLYDENELDTREVIRTLKYAKKLVTA